MKIDGIEVVDATKPVYIHITMEDVKKGGVKNPLKCAAARACVRDFKLTAARVHIGRIYMLKNNKWVRYQTPMALRTEIVSFDRGGGFEAGDYRLSPMAPSAALGTPHSEKKNSKKKGKPTTPRHAIVGIRPNALKGTK